MVLYGAELRWNSRSVSSSSLIFIPGRKTHSPKGELHFWGNPQVFGWKLEFNTTWDCNLFVVILLVIWLWLLQGRNFSELLKWTWMLQPGVAWWWVSSLPAVPSVLWVPHFMIPMAQTFLQFPHKIMVIQWPNWVGEWCPECCVTLWNGRGVDLKIL